MEDKLIEVEDSEIEVNFYVDGAEYVVLTNFDNKLDEIYIAKVVSIDESHDTLVSVTDEEYDKALDEYMSILEDLTEEDDDENWLW